MRSWSRILVWTGVLAGLSLAPVAVGWSALPDPVATHWGPEGLPDGSTPRIWIWAVPIFVVLVGLGLAVLLRRDGRPSAESMALVGFLGGIGIWTSTSIVVLNHGAETWTEAGSMGLWQIVVMIVGGIAVGAVGYALGRRWYPPPVHEPTGDVEAIEVAPGERVSWLGSVKVWWPFFVLLPFSVVFIFLPGWLQWLAPLYVILAFLFSRVEVSVDGRGLRVVLAGVFAVKRISLDKIVSARVIDLEPTEWAGWGYRVVPGGSAVVLRRGGAIEASLVGDRRFAVTVDDAATGAALLSGLVKREMAGR